MYNNIKPINILNTFQNNEGNVLQNTIEKHENDKKNEDKHENKNENKDDKKNKKVKKEIIIKESVKILDHKSFCKNKTILNTYKLDELKFVAKKFCLKFSGNKQILIERIKKFFIETNNAIIIQTLFRSWIVKFSINLRGPALKNRKICVNDTDFVTMEPLNEISNELFFSYKDNKDFVYGFNISSLIDLIRINGKFSNPYNREIIDNNLTKKIVNLYNLCFIIYPNFKIENKKFLINKINNNIQSTNNRNIRTLNNNFRNNENILDNENNIFNILNFHINEPNLLSDNQQIQLLKLEDIRKLTLIQRINNLFIELDYLGNYTQSEWFNNLDRNDYIYFYRILYDIWYYRNLPLDVRKKICPFVHPFSTMNIRNIISTPFSINEIKNICLTVCENLIYTGENTEYRKLGAFHILSGLTAVSLGARISMPWLYESLPINNIYIR
jgi:hypothetical protein